MLLCRSEAVSGRSVTSPSRQHHLRSVPRWFNVSSCETRYAHPHDPTGTHAELNSRDAWLTAVVLLEGLRTRRRCEHGINGGNTARSIHTSLPRIPFHRKRFVHHSDAGSTHRPGSPRSFADWNRRSIGNIGDALDNALMESAVGLYKSELIDSIRHLPVGPRVCGSFRNGS